MDNIPWIEKYRPRKLDEMVQEESLINLLKNSIKTGDIPHFLFYGPPGSGKTSAILTIGREIFGEHYASRVVEFNASDDRGINAVREKIANEAKKYVSEIIDANGRKIPSYKIIVLDEADSMTDEAQDALRVIIEQYSTVTRFCFICNYISKITDAIKSRCSIVYFRRLDRKCMIGKLKEISAKESMHVGENIFDAIINVSEGDMRKAIILLQNIKYLYSYKKFMRKHFSEMNVDELRIISKCMNNVEIDTEIIEDDVYEVAACISNKRANEIISETLKCKSIVEVLKLGRKVLSMGYPVDNMLIQLNRAVLCSKDFDEVEKAKIIRYSGDVLLRIKESANEYIQLVDYLSSIYGIKKGLTCYG
ncbi:MAG: AAA family ATPase [Nitrososphaerota archaeon]